MPFDMNKKARAGGVGRNFEAYHNSIPSMNNEEEKFLCQNLGAEQIERYSSRLLA